MVDYELVEADFQQFYNLELESIKFRRFSRLFSNLPRESRIIEKYAPAATWKYSDEIASQILLVLQNFLISFGNVNRKKGTSATKLFSSDNQFQPEYVKEAKQNYQRGSNESPINMDDTKEFWDNLKFERENG